MNSLLLFPVVTPCVYMSWYLILLSSFFPTVDFSQPIVALTKEAVNAAYETTLQQGVVFERRLFHSTFATKDQKEGMSAFVEKRKPTWSNE